MRILPTILLTSLLSLLYAGTLNAQWVQTKMPDSTMAVQGLTVRGPEVYAGARRGGELLWDTYIVHSADNGESWGIQKWIWANVFAVQTAAVFAGGQGVYLSTDNGTTWTEADSGLTNVGVLCFASEGQHLFAGTDSGVFLSTNNGTNWTAVNEGIKEHPVRALAMSGTNLFAGTNEGVFLSTNTGTSWTPTNNGLPLTKNIYDSLRCIGVLTFAVSGTNLFAGTDSGVFLSTNNGTNWTAVNNGLPKLSYDTTSYAAVYAFAVTGTNLFAGTDNGVFLTTNDGTTWQAVNTGLNCRVISLGLNDTCVFAGTYLTGPMTVRGRGVWRRPLTEMVTSVSLPLAELPTQFSLMQNYPNPFNPSTTIRYSLPRSSYVSLKVYDLLGRVVRTLVDDKRVAGEYTVNFDASVLPSGMYFYQIRAGSFAHTKQMILVR